MLSLLLQKAPEPVSAVHRGRIRLPIRSPTSCLAPEHMHSRGEVNSGRKQGSELTPQEPLRSILAHAVIARPHD